MEFIFLWDPAKAASDLRKHWVGFEEAMTVFDDPLSITIPDPAHSSGEERFLLLGCSERERLLLISHAQFGRYIRIISARTTTAAERNWYEEKR